MSREVLDSARPRRLSRQRGARHAGRRSGHGRAAASPAASAARRSTCSRRSRRFPKPCSPSTMSSSPRIRAAPRARPATRWARWWSNLDAALRRRTAAQRRRMSDLDRRAASTRRAPRPCRPSADACTTAATITAPPEAGGAIFRFPAARRSGAGAARGGVSRAGRATRPLSAPRMRLHEATVPFTEHRTIPGTTIVFRPVREADCAAA